MKASKKYFLCGVGGSGMLPLALILKAAGHEVEGSDRALDQGRLAAKFEYLQREGVGLHLQDGSGLVSPDQILVASAAVEDTVPDMVAARRLGASIVRRPELLAGLFNASPLSIGVAGTSGKSTTTAMVGWILHAVGRRPTVMNGAVMKNFATDGALFASALIGDGGVFVSELDESDGSIALYRPTVAVLNNISLDHKSMEELRRLFGDFVGRAETAVLNLDNAETAALSVAARTKLTYSLFEAGDFGAERLSARPFGIAFGAVDRRSGERARIDLKMPGAHNVSNALAAIAAAGAAGVPFTDAAAALNDFAGVKRRLEFVGERNGVTVIDDFAHNPDKIAASLRTLHEFPGRLLVLFQPHGFGPLKKMRAEFAQCFADHLKADDFLVMPDPVYFGGSVDRDVSSRQIVEDVAGTGRLALHFETRAECGEALLRLARPSDRIVIMGARDDTLSQFAVDLLVRLG
jgi:UDP-N-acetylmuramate--alanine ligase